MAKERADELVRQAREMLDKQREPTTAGSELFLDDVQAWTEACGAFVRRHGPNAENDIPREQKKAINLAVKDLEMERRYHVFMRQVYGRNELFLSRMEDTSVDPEKERDDAENKLKVYGEFIKRFQESTRTHEFQGRCPVEYERMINNMEEVVAHLRHAILVTPSILDEFADESDEVMHKSIRTMSELLEFENHPSVDQINAKKSALSRMSYSEDSGEENAETNAKFQEVQRDLLKALLGVDGPKITGNKKLSDEYNKILTKFEDPNSRAMESQNKIAQKVIQLHERILDKRIKDVLAAMRDLLNKSDVRNEGAGVKEFRKIFKEVELDHKEIKDAALSYKMANLSVLEGGLENLKRLLSVERKSKPPVWTSPEKTAAHTRPPQLRDSGNIPRSADAKKPMIGHGRGQKKENPEEDVSSRHSKGPGRSSERR